MEQKLLVIAGAWLFILPFTGFPHSWKTVLTVITGLIVIYLGVLLWRRDRAQYHAPRYETRSDTFTETP